MGSGGVKVAKGVMRNDRIGERETRKLKGVMRRFCESSKKKRNGVNGFHGR